MGGDGGTIGSTRAYLRGAGKALHTADHPSSARERSKKAVTDDIVGRAKLTLSTCAVSGDVLDFSPGATARADNNNNNIDIVACPYGRLYKREKILEALLRRARDGGGGDDNVRNNNEHAKVASVSISHIRGMKDLHSIRFHVTKIPSNGKNGTYYTPSCPITGSDIGSGKVPSYVIVRSSTKMNKKNGVEDDEASRGPNVLSERAIKEMGVQGLQVEFGPFEEKDMILLAPPQTGGVFDEIKRKWEERVETERVAKLEKKKDKKRKTVNTLMDMKPATTKTNHAGRGSDNINNDVQPINEIKKPSSSAVNAARSTVQSAISHNPVLLNLFGVGKDGKRQKTTEKEKKDALFTRNC